MKTLKLHLIVLALLFASISYSQTTCSSSIYKYKGPTNAGELRDFLQTSTDSVIINLSQSFKNMLNEVIIFKNDRIAGFNPESTNPDIALFYASNAAEVFSAIFKTHVSVVTSDNRPTVQRITVAEFNTLTAGGIAFGSDYSLCLNCRGLDGGLGKPGEWCCRVDGNGCVDIILNIDGVLYAVD